MGVYSLVLLFLGLLTIGLLYAKTGDHGRAGHHLLFAVILVGFLLAFFGVHHYFQHTCEILIAGNLDQTIRLIRSWGVAAPLMSMLLMVIQAIVAPLPAFLITAANGMIFGMFWGAVISWTGALLGALTSFYIARLAGEVAADKMIRSQKARDFLRHAGEKRGFWMVLAARLLPFISFDFISYLAGLSGIRVWAFGLATGLGMIPATLAYTLFGRELPLLEEHSPLLLTATTVLIFVLVAYSFAQMMRKKS